MPETRHHDGQRHGQAERSHHAADGHAGAFAHTPRTLYRQHGQCPLGHERAEPAVKQADQARQRADTADQQERHRQVGAQCDAGHRWQQRQQAAGQQHGQAQPGTAVPDRRHAQALEALRGGQLLGRARRPPAANQSRHHTQTAVGQRSRPAPLQGRRDAGKVTATQVAAQQTQGQCRQCRAQCHASGTAQQSQQQRFAQHQLQPRCATQTQHPQQGQLLGAFGHAQRQHGEHQKRTREKRYQRQDREVDAVSA